MSRLALRRRDTVYGSVQAVVGDFPLVLEMRRALVFEKLHLHSAGGYVISARRTDSDAVVRLWRELERKAEHEVGVFPDCPDVPGPFFVPPQLPGAPQRAIAVHRKETIGMPTMPPRKVSSVENG